MNIDPRSVSILKKKSLFVDWKSQNEKIDNFVNWWFYKVLMLIQRAADS